MQIAGWNRRRAFPREGGGDSTIDPIAETTWRRPLREFRSTGSTNPAHIGWGERSEPQHCESEFCWGSQAHPNLCELKPAARGSGNA